MNSVDTSSRARRLFVAAYREHRQGHIEAAIPLYQASIDARPTSLAHTYLGSAYGEKGMVDRALAECHRAIEVDPDLGLPYHDIGIYLTLKGHLTDSIGWLEKAKHAPRKTPGFGPLPHLSLGRVHLALGSRHRALAEFRQALSIDPENAVARKAIAELLQHDN